MPTRGTSRRRASIAAIVVAITTTFTACHPAGDGTSSRTAVGDCFAKDDVEDVTAGPDLSTKVTCSTKHLYEVIGSIDIPDRFVRGESRRELLRERTRLSDLQLEYEDGTFSQFNAFMARACSRFALNFAGLGDLDIGGRAAVDLLAEPAVSSAYTEWFLPPKRQWLDRQEAYCAFHFDESAAFGYAEADGVSAPTDETLASQVMDPTAPMKARFCFDYNAYGDADQKSCAKVHDGEVFLSYEVDAMTGSSRLGDRIDLEHEVSRKQHDIMLEPCLDSIKSVLGPLDPELYVDVLWGDRQWFGKGQRRAQCVVTTDSSHQLPGRSLMRNARDVHLVERPKPT
jgi:hypothetical protein